MNSTDLHDQFRSDVGDDIAPYLWSSDEIYRWLGDAQNMFCRLTGGLGDGSSAATRLAAPVSGGWVDTSPLILKIRDAWRTSDGASIEVLNYEDLPTRGLRMDGAVGPTRYLIIGMEPHRAVMYPAPNDATLVIQLLIDRLPLKPINDAEQKLEVDEMHHLHLLSWVKSRAYLKQDAETYDKVASERNEAIFRNYCAAAKAEKDRAKHKTRVVTYGGI